ncbi:MAG TPA: hypothetical protein VMZ29_12095 [Candidatus Bathyarchaeia archaeon]|nr:hypothetical protein [Candidatus Bathyarchaeia archaeon]
MVQLHDFALIEKHINSSRVFKIPHEVLLTAEDAFLNFANMNVSYNLNFLMFKGFTPVDNVQDYNIYMLLEKSSHNQLLNHLKLFCFDYLAWLQDQLSSQTISCSKVLQLSGAPVLVLLVRVPIVQRFVESGMNYLTTNYASLSRNQKLQYFLLFSSLKELNALPTITEFFQKNEPLLNQLRNDFLTHYMNIPANQDTSSLGNKFMRNMELPQLKRNHN